MRKFLKNIFNRIKDAWYGILPVLILFGIPTLLCVIIGWEKLVAIVKGITELGNGSFFLGVLFFLSLIIVVFNLFVGFMCAIDKISKKTSPKWTWVYIITTVVGYTILTIMFRSLFHLN